VRLATRLEEVHAAGGEVVALVVDSPERNAAMAARWSLPFPIESDPDGSRWLQPLGLWNEAERGGLAIGATLVIDPDGREVMRTTARDFADRPSDEPALTALTALALDAIEPLAPWQPDVAPEENSPGFRPDAYGTYFRGYFYGAFSLELRATSEEARAEAKAAKHMAQSMLDAWKAWSTR
jgi:hypothetical protein